MVGILQFLDFAHASSSRKMPMLSRHIDGVEAPRKSLEFPMEACQSSQMVHEDIPYSRHYSDKEDICRHGAYMKKLIGEEMTDRTKDQRNRPSVVARLMGMDSLPSDMKPMIHARELNDEKRPRKEPAGIPSDHQALFILKPMKYSKKELFPYHIDRELDQRNRDFEMNKPQPREHPQEELLQKFKKEFEAWQASKVRERSVTLELGNDLQEEKYMYTLPQENLNREKMSRYVDHNRNTFMKKITEPSYHVPSARPNIDRKQEGVLKYETFVSKHSENGLRKNNAFRDNNKTNFFAPKPDHGMNLPTSPRRIVILKPSYEMNDSTEGSCLSSPMMFQKGKNMHDFLEQVKERLIIEMRGKPGLETPTRWTEAEAISERLADSKQIAPKKGKHIREGVSNKDDKTSSMQSRSTRSYRNEVQLSGQSSPEFISRDTRKALSERKKNVLKDETDMKYPLCTSGRTITKLSNKEAENSMQFFAKKGNKKVAYCKKRKALTESKSFRHDQRQAFDDDEEFPRNLVRSFSAPVSGTAFGKLLSEDKHALTAVHIHRKHEASENDLLEVRKIKKNGFNIRSRVSSLRQNFTLKGKSFGKRSQSLDESAVDEFPFMKAVETAPSVVINLGFAQDNSTEVPPSPASVCSSSHDEICRPYYPSPVSPLEAIFHEDHPSLPASEELNSYPPESSLSEELELEYERPEEATDEIKPDKDEPPQLEGNAKNYVRDIVVTSGLFERNHFDHVLSEWDTPRKPISMLVFEEIEESYQSNGKLESRIFLLCDGLIDVSHRILFDLLNEALLRLVQNSKPGSALKQWFPSPRRVPHGNELVESLWHQIQSYINPLADDSYSIEGIVAQYMNGTPWSGMRHEDIDTICVEMESLIIEDLIKELVYTLSC